jgi:hypothetical protein
MKLTQRNIITPRQTTVRFRSFSPKNDQVIETESVLERDFMLRLEFAPHVVSFQSQPPGFHAMLEGKAISVYPDFMAELDDGAFDEVEVKYFHQSRKPKTWARLEAARLQRLSEGRDYYVKTEKDIRSCQQVLSNCLFLKGFKGRSMDHVAALSQMVPHKPTTFGALAAECGDRTIVAEMIAQQLVFCDFYQLITDASVLRPLKPGDFDYMY